MRVNGRLKTMKMTKYTHSCIRLENEGRTLVLDPGNFAAEGEHATALEGADYLFVTHAHPDHFDGPSVLPLIAQRAESQTPLKIWAPEAVAQVIKEAVPDAEVTVVSSDSEFSIPGFEVKTYGGQHALIHPLIQTIANVGYLINGAVYHPGDSLVVPHRVRANTVLVPIHAPWSKVQEVIDFVIATGAQRVVPIHNGMINQNGTGIIEGLVTNFGAKYGTELKHLNPGESIEVEA